MELGFTSSSAVHAFVLGKVLRKRVEGSLDHTKNVGFNEIGFSMRTTRWDRLARPAIKSLIKSAVQKPHMERVTSRVALLQITFNPKETRFLKDLCAVNCLDMSVDPGPLTDICFHIFAELVEN